MEKPTERINLNVGPKHITEAIWWPDQKIVEIKKLKGNFWKKMGETFDGRNFLHPEEALFLLEQGLIIIYDKIEMFQDSKFLLNTFYDMIVKNVSPYQAYLVYGKLKSLNYIVKRYKKGKISVVDSDEFFSQSLNLSPNEKLIDTAVSYNIYHSSPSISKKMLKEAIPCAHVIVTTYMYTFSAYYMLKLIDEAAGVPIIFAIVYSNGSVCLEEFNDSLTPLLDNRTFT